MKTHSCLSIFIMMASVFLSSSLVRAMNYSETNTIICVGDSLTFGTGAGTIKADCDNFHDGRLNGRTIPWSYPYRLAKRIGSSYNVVAQAKPGKCVDYMVAWMGGTGLATRQALTLPAQLGTSVNFATNLVFTETFPNGWVWVRGHATAGNKWAGCGIPTLPLCDIGIEAGKNPCGSSPDSGSLDGWLADIPVRISGGYANTTLVIERLNSGASVTLPAGTPFVTKCEKSFRDAIYVVFGGYNDGYYGSGVNAYTNYLPLIEAAVAKIPSKRYVVISPHCKSANDPSSQSQLEAAFSNAFGAHHLNLRTELDARGVALAAQFGASVSDWHALLSDDVHFSSVGYDVLAYLVEEKLRALGYLSATPAKPSSTYAKPYVAKWKGNRKGAYTYTFDDGIADQYTLAFPQLKKYGIRGTFFLIGEQMLNGRENRFTWAQAKEMSQAGMEIGSHGYTHEYLTTMTKAETEVEIQKNIEVLEKYIGYKPKSYAYAYNQTGPYSQAILKEKGCYLSRTTQTDIGGWTAAKLDAEVNKYAGNGTWGVGMIHGINSSYHPWSNPEELYRHWRHMSTNSLIWIDTFTAVGIYKKLYEKTAVTITEEGGNSWRISVTAPALERDYYNGKLDLVLGDGTCRSFDPFAGDFTITLGETPQVHTHTYGPWKTNSVPTCVAQGMRIRFCTQDGCASTEQETLSSIGHFYNWVVTRNSTETQTGEKQLKCTVCGTIKETATIPCIGTLPSEFTPLEYVSSTATGGQYIDTGISAQPELSASITLTLNGYDTSNNTYALAAYEKDAEAYLVSIGKNGQWSWSLGNLSPARPIGPNFTTGMCYQITSTIAADSRTMTFEVNGQQGPAYKAAQKGTSQYTLYLLARNEKGIAGRFLDAKIHAAQISVGGRLVRDYIPCQTKDNVAGLYDSVEGIFHPSASTNAAFLAGPIRSAPSSMRPTINGKEVDFDEIFTVASSQTPINFPIAPILDGEKGKNQTLSFENQTIKIPTWYSANLEGKTLSLNFTGTGAQPKISDFTITKTGLLTLKNANTKESLWYSIGTKSNFLDEWTWGVYEQGSSTFIITPQAASGFYKIRVQDHK